MTLTESTPPAVTGTHAYGSDDALIAACRAGDANAWETVIETYKRLVFSIPLRYGLPREAAEDIVQSTFIALMNHLSALRPGSNLAAWLCTVARRKTWLGLKKERLKEPLPSDADEIERQDLFAVSDDTQSLENWDQRRVLQQGIAKLGTMCQSLLLNLYLGEPNASYEDVAQKLGMPLGSIGPRRARCLAELRKYMGEIQ